MSSVEVNQLPISAHVNWARQQDTVDRTYTNEKTPPPTQIVASHSISSALDEFLNTDMRPTHFAHFEPPPATPRQFLVAQVPSDEAKQPAEEPLIQLWEILEDLHEMKSAILSEILRVQKG